jgi:signal transduction histidine kinase
VTGRRRWMLWAACAYAGILVAVVAGLLLLYRGARDRLDHALGLRLQAVASSTALFVDGDRIPDWSFDPEPASDLVWLASRLERIQRENELAELTLCDPGGFVIVSTSGRLVRGDFNVFWDLDRAAVDQASAGFTAASRLYRAGDLYQKSAHAPVFDRHGEVAAVLTVEGDADFFDVLATLRRGAVATGAVVLAFLALMGWLLWRIHRSLERARDSLARQERLAAMGRMTAGIAHEIRNPLGIIRGAGQHLERVLAEHGIADETSGFIAEEVDRLDRILAGYLGFGGAGEDEGLRESLDLATLVRRTVRLVATELEETGVVCVLAEPLPAAPCQGDPRRLQQVLLNLLLNARDAMPGGGEVRLAVATADGMHSVSVSDHGPGLGSASPEQVFEPFWTSKPRGSGLGLAVSRQIAREHGGELTLHDRPHGSGCVAVLTLPAREA